MNGFHKNDEESASKRTTRLMKLKRPAQLLIPKKGIS
jgi:hypothetical protein